MKIPRKPKNLTAQRLWAVIGSKPFDERWSAAELAREARASGAYTRKYIYALVAAGYARRDGADASFAPPIPCYRRAREFGPLAAHLVQGQHPERGRIVTGLWDPNEEPPMPPGDLKRIRKKLGFSQREMSRALGWADSSSYQIRLMEAGGRLIAPEVAEKIRSLAK